MTGEANQHAGTTSQTQSGLLVSAFRNLLAAFEAMRLPLVPDAQRKAAERQREEVRLLIESRITDAKWRDLMQRAREAAERGQHEYLLLRFPAADCTDHGRAIIQQEPGWPDTLTGDAAAIYRHWRDDIRPHGFRFVARILEFTNGMPGDVGLFLTWPDPGPDPGPDPAAVTMAEARVMKTMLLLTASGPLVILTSHASPLEPALLNKLAARGIRKFIAFEIPIELARQRYGTHFAIVRNDLHETDDLRVLDFDGQHAFQLFRFAELGQPIFHEGT
jgi:hypothetical protein